MRMNFETCHRPRLFCTRRPVVLIVCFLLIASGCATVGKDVPGVSNFGEVEKGQLYRGAQPSEKGIHYLADNGIRTVVNLRDDPQKWEKQAVEKAGMQYVWIPSTASKADPKVVDKFLTTMRQGDTPVFVHCKAGRDRTGLNVAAYRIIHDDWDRKRAITELHAYGYNWALFPGIEKYLKTFINPSSETPMPR